MAHTKNLILKLDYKVFAHKEVNSTGQKLQFGVCLAIVGKQTAEILNYSTSRSSASAWVFVVHNFFVSSQILLIFTPIESLSVLIT